MRSIPSTASTSASSSAKSIRAAFDLEVALRLEVVCLQELRQPVYLAGPECDVHEREVLEHLLLQGLRPAAPHANDPRRVLGLEPFCLAEVADEAVVGGLPNR